MKIIFQHKHAVVQIAGGEAKRLTPACLQQRALFRCIPHEDDEPKHTTAHTDQPYARIEAHPERRADEAAEDHQQQQQKARWPE
jgi:hypothetical protein